MYFTIIQLKKDKNLLIYKTLYNTIIIPILICSCSLLKNNIYIPYIYQGNYLTTNDINKIYIGMTKKQVFFLLGKSTALKNPFNSKKIYYICRYTTNNNLTIQQTLTLFFNKNETLTHMKNKKIILKN